MVEHLPGVREVVGTIPSRVIPKTLKMVPDASLLSARHLTDRSRTCGRFPLLSTVKYDRVECYINVPVIEHSSVAALYLLQVGTITI